MKVKSESEVAQLCQNPSDSMDCSPPGSSVHGIFQARGLQWVAIAFSLLQGTFSESITMKETTMVTVKQTTMVFSGTGWTGHMR